MTAAEIDRLLNPEQAEAVKTLSGPVLVLAGAGTGKTRVITYRIAHMIDSGIAPEHILGMTFTNKAAREMKARLAELVGPEQVKKLTVGTFHAFCARVLRREIKLLHYLPGFGIIDDADQDGLIRQAAAILGFAKNEVPVPAVKSYIGSMKNKLFSPAQAKKEADFADNPDKVRFARVYEEYQNLLEIQNVVDFDDMLMLVHEIFRKFPEVLEKYQGQYKYVLVDEYQDTNDAQFAIIEQLAGQHRNLCVVGDDDQSIYGWRGANIGNILDFSARFPETREIKLEQNYRSTSKILAAANAVIGRNPGRHAKKLWSVQGEGENLILVKNTDAEAEAALLADYINQVMNDQPGRSYNDFAILYRSNHLSRHIELALRQAGIPYRMVGGQEFFQRKEIKDAAAYLKLLANPKDDQSLLRILNLPPRGLGRKVVETLKYYQAASFRPFSELIGEAGCRRHFTGKGAETAAELDCCCARYREEFAVPGDIAANVKNFLVDVGYLNGLQKIYKDQADSLKRRENVYEFINAVAEFEKRLDYPPTLQEYLESYSLLQENDKVDDRTEDGRGGVTLATVHAAKGLEYPYVLLPAVEQGVFPHQRSVQEGSEAEELRLFYVALTRAREQVLISFAASRLDKGVEHNRLPSPFLKYLPEDVVDVCEPDDLVKEMDKDELSASLAAIQVMLAT
ncbi:MAG: UvrD-helicase domain-containing protein [Victivallales bacterium]|nr:UvrD-helicase domain-containing protein [Victivallales bacterium]